MQTIQVLLEKELLTAVDQAARRTKQNRSALIRDALRGHLHRLEVRAREEQDRQGYASQPAVEDESRFWEAQAEWPRTE